jgi:PTS system nitrogen regulatory IIA component
MSENIMTIEAAAKYLRVSERTVYDWAQKGEIPAVKTGTIWRFRKDSLERWMNERLSGANKFSQPQTVCAESIIVPERIMFLSYENKGEALLALAANLCTAPQITNQAELNDAILRREQLISTAIGCGVAIPHVRLASVSDLVMSVGISRIPISGFLPLDNEPVKILIMVAAAYTQHTYYLQTLSFFSARLKNHKLRNALIAAKDEYEIRKLLVS